jgi:hypothetical protein
MASNATFALKAAEWLRRGLLTVCSPRAGEIFAQLSKAVTFYPTVRIRGTTSLLGPLVPAIDQEIERILAKLPTENPADPS